MKWCAYIFLCKDGSFYTGNSNDVEARVKQHNSGRASKYTRVRRPVELLYAEECDSHSAAAKRELEVKSFSIDNKKRLIKYGKGQRFPSAHKIK